MDAGRAQLARSPSPEDRSPCGPFGVAEAASYGLRVRPRAAVFPAKSELLSAVHTPFFALRRRVSLGPCTSESPMGWADLRGVLGKQDRLNPSSRRTKGNELGGSTSGLSLLAAKEVEDG
jgi:hypothetical protein